MREHYQYPCSHGNMFKKLFCAALQPLGVKRLLECGCWAAQRLSGQLCLVQDRGDGMSFIVLVTKWLLGKVFFPPGHSLMHRSTQSYSHIPEHSPRHPGCRSQISLCGCSDSWAQLKPVLGLSCPCLSGKMSLWLCGEQGEVTACLSLQPAPMGTMGWAAQCHHVTGECSCPLAGLASTAHIVIQGTPRGCTWRNQLCLLLVYYSFLI